MANATSRLDQERAVFGEIEPGTETRISNTTFFIGYLAAAGMTAVATLVAFGLESGVHIPNLSLVYVVPVIVAGISYGVGPSLCAAVLGALAYNFFFTEPRYSLMVDDPANIWAIALLFIVGVIVSTIAFNARRKAADVAIMTREVGALQRFSKEIAASRDVNAIQTVGAQALASVFGVPAIVLTLKDGEVDAFKAVAGIQPGTSDFAAAKSALQMGTVSRARTYPNQGARFDFWPIGNTLGQPGVIGLAFTNDDRPSAQDELVDIIRNTMALALDRAALHASSSVTPSARN